MTFPDRDTPTTQGFDHSAIVGRIVGGRDFDLFPDTPTTQGFSKVIPMVFQHSGDGEIFTFPDTPLLRGYAVIPLSISLIAR